MFTSASFLRVDEVEVAIEVVVDVVFGVFEVTPEDEVVDMLSGLGLDMDVVDAVSFRKLDFVEVVPFVEVEIVEVFLTPSCGVDSTDLCVTDVVV